MWRKILAVFIVGMIGGLAGATLINTLPGATSALTSMGKFTPPTPPSTMGPLAQNLNQLAHVATVQCLDPTTKKVALSVHIFGKAEKTAIYVPLKDGNTFAAVERGQVYLVDKSNHWQQIETETAKPGEVERLLGARIELIENCFRHISELR